MKKLKIFLVGLLVLMSSACSSQGYPSLADVEITVIEGARQVDMSSYDYMEEGYDNHFLEVTTEEMLTLINSGGTGIFYLGHPNCSACNLLVRYIEAAAEEVDATIYYIDVYSDEDGFEASYSYVVSTLYEILTTYEGYKTVLTPHVFAVKDGEFTDSQVGAYTGYDTTDDSTGQVMIDRYIEVFTSLLDSE